MKLDALIVICGSLISLLALTVLLGWHLHLSLLVQIRPNYAPMQYQTAIGFLFLGLGLLMACRHNYWGILFAILPLLLGSLVLLEYFSPIQINIDQIFIKPFLLVKSSYPGRMAPNSALSMILSALALLLSTPCRRFPERKLTAFFLSSLVLIIGLIALIGYLANLPTAYGWGKLTGMALHTSIGFIIFGIGAITTTLKGSTIKEFSNLKLFPATTFIIGAVFFLAIWQSLVADEHHQLLLKAENEAGEMIRDTNIALSTQLKAMRRLRARIEFPQALSEAQWQDDAKQYMHDMNFYEAIALVDRQKNKTWLVGKKIDACLKSDLLNENTLKSREAKISFLNLEHFCLLTPTSKGILIGLINTPLFIKYALDPITPSPYRLLLNRNNQFSTVSEAKSPVLSTEWQTRAPLNKIDKDLFIVLWPTQLTLQASETVFPKFLLIIGFILNLFLALALYFWMSSKKQSIFLLEEIQRRKQLESNFQALATLAADAIITVDSNEKIIFWNEAATRIFGYQPEEAIGKRVIDLLVPKRYIHSHTRTFTLLHKTKATSAFKKPSEMIAKRKDGSEIPVEMSMSMSMSSTNGEREITGIIRDISERKKNEALIHHQANYDALTDLPNRLLFSDRLTLALDQAERTSTLVALMMLDLDDFKDLNDKYGHKEGDELLMQFSQRLIQCIRKTDTAARMGGDEFMIILTNVKDKNEIHNMAEKILTRISSPFDIFGQTMTFTSSIGIALYPQNAQNQDELIKKADIAMYEAKRAGKNRIFYA